MKRPVVYFSHGMESSPHGTKIRVLSKIAETLGFEYEAPDYSDTQDPEIRVKRLAEICLQDSRPKVFVGSSMGGYVSLCTSELTECRGLFLMAPALYLDGYRKQQFQIATYHISVIHGYRDDVIPFEHSLRFSKKQLCDLHLLNSDHRLNDRLEDISEIFQGFLKRFV